MSADANALQFRVDNRVFFVRIIRRREDVGRQKMWNDLSVDNFSSRLNYHSSVDETVSGNIICLVLIMGRRMQLLLPMMMIMQTAVSQTSEWVSEECFTSSSTHNRSFHSDTSLSKQSLALVLTTQNKQEEIHQKHKKHKKKQNCPR